MASNILYIYLNLKTEIYKLFAKSLISTFKSFPLLKFRFAVANYLRKPYSTIET